jgi:hypothetical protein
MHKDKIDAKKKLDTDRINILKKENISELEYSILDDTDKSQYTKIESKTESNTNSNNYRDDKQTSKIYYSKYKGATFDDKIYRNITNNDEEYGYTSDFCKKLKKNNTLIYQPI